MRKKFFWIIILTTILIFTLGCGNIPAEKNSDDEYQKIRMVMVTSGTENGINTLVAKKFAENVKNESGGNVVIEVYSNDKLVAGNSAKGVRMLANGSVDMAVYTSSTFSLLDKNLSVATLPWTFKNYKDAGDTIGTTGGEYYKKIFAEQSLIYLGATHNGFRQIFNNRNPVIVPEDLYKMRIRILNNEVSKKFFQALDVDAIPMSRIEMENALKQGTIDGHDMGIYQASSAKLEKFEKFVTIWNYSYEDYIFVISTKIFNQLEPKTQELLKKKSNEAFEWGNKQLEKNERESEKQLTKNGLKVIKLSPQEIENFKDKICPSLNNLKSQYDEEALRAFGIE